MIQEVRVIAKDGIPDSKGEEVLYEINQALGIKSVEKVKTARVFRFEGVQEEQAVLLAEKLLAEDVFEFFSVNKPVFSDAPFVLEVAYKPGVMNPEAASLLKSASDLGINGLLAADSAWQYAFYGHRISQSDIDRIINSLLVNATVEYVVKESPATLLIQGTPGQTTVVPLRDMNDDQLLELSRDKLFLNLQEMKVIQNHFNLLGRDPTDCEIEIIAQTWSEHCGHKTFKAKLIVDGKEKRPLLKRLRDTTEKLGHPLVLSAFVDNSGVMDFYEGMAICGKVETHNSPSAIEPYGGAMTGSGGVFRDIAGTGLGAKVIASTDMFCFAPPDLPETEIPPGCLHPHYLLRRVVAGVRDYGNRMGIPTNNGSVHFHSDFRAKPTVIVGAYGILPAQACRKGQPQPGDLVVAMGGRTGRDGIHGATFSSGEMTDRTIEVNASAVQIGHPIEEKRMFDAILTAREDGLIRAITDCGAGGFASAVGEMGSETGARIALDRAPLKYPGLAPWEILLSESQERMVLAVAPENAGRLFEICRGYNVEATVLGEFTGDGYFSATYHDREVMRLSMEFLHDGLPQRIMKAAWQKPSFAEPEIEPASDWNSLFQRVLSQLNVCSKEPIVRLYDHGVQGTSALPPYAGVNWDGPNDAVILTPLLGRTYGMVISHGLNPVLNQIDPYFGSLWAAAEAVANAVAAGADHREMVLIDNFIWPFPDEELLGALDLAVDACVDFSSATGMPFISGKDSLSSTYRGKDGSVIKIPPVLCVSAFGRIQDVSLTVSTDFKKAGSQIVLVGFRNTAEMAGSVYYQILGYTGNNLPKLNPSLLNEVFTAVHKAAASGILQACHDISEGGLAAALAEMCFGGGLGAKITVPGGEQAEQFFFNETAGCFLAELPAGANPGLIFGQVPCTKIGETIDACEISATRSGDLLFSLRLDDLKQAWQRPMKEVFR
ncbi:phosphoribosylformylglycinamidine synthase subunit PurL [Pelotomaculum propionicicum]|uniref:Phosphoribosylformylglycinamidine synthase subunit PurL n=1 Tax=Pelotomaculum propionicicum TaxID=258475 RepID=A0A4Y7RPR5_9FIRM|nr:phosphoribosylformylglycinamidine synthase subunit PurL [Pelotomaculum propionicicum]TEB10730.1 Phosphoribosylformylglycinamidine synthase subunit PurL [Pelotomaculum propionicicum]